MPTVTDDDLSPRQIEFRERLSSLLGEYAAAVGPEFDGHSESQPMSMPVPVGWVLITDWDDATGDNDPSVVQINSGLRWTSRLGLMRAGLLMAEGE